MVGGAPPEDLCGEHQRIWHEWSRLEYNPRHPCEWPGTAIIMDNRASHEDRARDWDRKSQEQMDLTAKICRSGRSPQCGPALGRKIEEERCGPETGA